MTWTYDSSLSTDRDKVRLRTGDTDTTDQLISNEGIDYLLDLHGDDVERTVYESAKVILAGPTVARAVDRNGTGFSAVRSQRFQHLKDLVAQFEAASQISAEVTYTGGSQAVIDALASDTDYIPAAFGRNQFDNTGE